MGGQRAKAATKVVKCEFTTNAMQNFDESLGMLHITCDSSLVHFKTYFVR